MGPDQKSGPFYFQSGGEAGFETHGYLFSAVYVMRHTMG
jgi:hypothetical protein